MVVVVRDTRLPLACYRCRYRKYKESWIVELLFDDLLDWCDPTYTQQPAVYASTGYASTGYASIGYASIGYASSTHPTPSRAALDGYMHP